MKPQALSSRLKLAGRSAFPVFAFAFAFALAAAGCPGTPEPASYNNEVIVEVVDDTPQRRLVDGVTVFASDESGAPIPSAGPAVTVGGQVVFKNLPPNSSVSAILETGNSLGTEPSSPRRVMATTFGVTVPENSSRKYTFVKHVVERLGTLAVTIPREIAPYGVSHENVARYEARVGKCRAEALKGNHPTGSGDTYVTVELTRHCVGTGPDSPNAYLPVTLHVIARDAQGHRIQDAVVNSGAVSIPASGGAISYTMGEWEWITEHYNMITVTQNYLRSGSQSAPFPVSPVVAAESSLDLLSHGAAFFPSVRMEGAVTPNGISGAVSTFPAAIAFGFGYLDKYQHVLSATSSVGTPIIQGFVEDRANLFVPTSEHDLTEIFPVDAQFDLVDFDPSYPGVFAWSASGTDRFSTVFAILSWKRNYAPATEVPVQWLVTAPADLELVMMPQLPEAIGADFAFAGAEMRSRTFAIAALSQVDVYELTEPYDHMAMRGGLSAFIQDIVPGGFRRLTYTGTSEDLSGIQPGAKVSANSAKKGFLFTDSSRR